MVLFADKANRLPSTPYDHLHAAPVIVLCFASIACKLQEEFASKPFQLN